MRFKDLITEAPSKPVNGRVQLINDLLRETDSNYKMKLVPLMLDEAMTEAIHMMKRIHRGADDDEIISNVALLEQAMKNTRKAILPFPTLARSMEHDGVWFDNETVNMAMNAVQTHQFSIADSASLLQNLHVLLLAMTGLYRLYIGHAGHDGLTMDEAERAFLKAGFKKLGIID